MTKVPGIQLLIGDLFGSALVYTTLAKRIRSIVYPRQVLSMKTKSGRHAILFIALGSLVSCMFTGCGQSASSLVSPMPIAQPVNVIENYQSMPSPPAKEPAVNDDVKAEEWNVVETFTGTGSETTLPFHVSGPEWRIMWTIDAEYPEKAALDLTIYCQEAPYAIWQTISHSDGSGGDATYYIPYEDKRDFYIKVRARNLNQWTIVIKDRATEVSLSHIQITHIHYKGTVYPPDPGKCLCFERVEPDEYIVIKNIGNCFQEISNWTSKNLTKEYPSFNFPSDCFLLPGQIIRIYTDELHPESGGFSFCYGHGDIWDNNKPDIAVLYNAAGKEVSRKSYSVSTGNISSSK